MTSHYAERIKEFRMKRAWPQEQLADVSGVSVRTIQRAESGTGASFETLKAMANAFGIDVGECSRHPRNHRGQAHPRPQSTLRLSTPG
jgi:transcriptional regulator with XRE-family HTH domain